MGDPQRLTESRRIPADLPQSVGEIVSAVNASRDSAPAPEPGARVLPLRRGPGVTVLSEESLAQIHEATLRVLEETGIEIGPGAMLERLEAAGAQGDAEAGRVRFPRSLVEEALRRPACDLVLAARDPACDLRLDGSAGWLSAGGGADAIVDLESGDRRSPTEKDLADVSRVADAVPQIGFLWQSVVALDVPATTRPLHELHAQHANTSKHIQLTTATDARQAEGAVEIARIVAGGERQLRERPVLSAFQRSRSPLAYEAAALEAAVTFAEAGVPCGFVATSVAGTSAPATRAGRLVVSHAELLAGVTALELLVPDAPTFCGTRGGLVDPGTGEVSSGGLEDLLFHVASAELAHRYDLPAHIGIFATGAKAPDWQAGLEEGLASFVSWLAGAEMVCAAGMLHDARVFSLSEMLLDAELFDLVRTISLGFDVDEEAMAVEVIEKVGPAGHFLGEEHTLRHMRESWLGKCMDTNTWEDWEEAGKPEPAGLARERALELLSTHEPMPLAEGAEERILEVIAEYERDRG